MPVSEGIQKSHPFKSKGGTAPEKGAQTPQVKAAKPKVPQEGDAQGIEHHTQTAFLNPNPFHQWYGIKNVAKVRINGETCMALLNNGVQINTIMPGFIKNCSFDVGPLSDLVGK